MKKTVAIIGATTEQGAAVAEGLLTGNWHLLLLDDNTLLLDKVLEELKAIDPGTDAEVLQCMVDGCWEADIIIMAVPAETPVRLREVANGKTVIGFAGNEVRPQQWIKELPYSKVIILSSIHELVNHLNKI